MQFNTTWIEPEEMNEERVKALALEMNTSKTFIHLCLNRGLTTKEEITHFMQPSSEWFHDPFTLYEMEKTVNRIEEAITAGEKITIYGDYDADGVTSTVILYEALEMIGGQVDYYIPNRFVEGYGPNIEAFDKIIANGTKLIITVDNGVTGHEAIDHAISLGADVIITDHHECPEVLPNAYSIVHPRHPKGNYACGDLSGAGVSLKLATALLGEIPEELLDLAAIGTIADLVSLTGENRAIAYFGLKGLKHSQRLGMLSLLEAASIPLDSADEETIGFKIAPPINAVGRLGDATLVVDLLTTFDEIEAQRLSQVVLSKNEERKKLVEKITKEAFKKIEGKSGDSVIVLYEKDWHEGVLGIVASRVTEKVNKPTLILTIDEENQKVKGSGRSIKGFNIYDCLKEIKGYLTHFGGHEMACGLSLKLNDLDDFIQALNQEAVKAMAGSEKVKQVLVDGTVAWDDVTIELIGELNKLKPFGQDNTKPLLKVEAVYPENVKVIGADQTHLKASLSRDNKQIDMIAFQSAHWSEILSSRPTIDVIGFFNINEWNGNRKVQLMASDYKTHGAIIIDHRKKNEQERLLKRENTHFVFFNEGNLDKFQPLIHPTSSSYLIEDGKELSRISEVDDIVIVDIPDKLEMFNDFYRRYHNNPLYLFFYAPNEYYFKGMPKREQFTKLYKWLHQKKEVDLSKDTKALRQFMKLDNNEVKFMLMVFLENEFVTIDSGKLNIVSQPQKRNLEDTLTYKKRLEQIKSEELLVYSSFNELLAYLKEIKNG